MTEINGALSAGLQGFQRASLGVSEASNDIARQPVVEQQQREQQQQVQQADQAIRNEQPLETAAPPNVTNSLTQLVTEQTNAAANARTIETADEVLGTIIDVTV
ncbi:hypothetical protein [Algicola sagamiensis]|uniref:hypothetical protein n=1 Tax=Algicola sagamiensis TaxID=163869 RepID=UPI00037FC0B9|nr:hypothetical protein [Algicola sagamiensis]